MAANQEFETLFDIFEDRVISGAVLITEMEYLRETGQHYSAILKHPLLFKIAYNKISDVVTDMAHFVAYSHIYQTKFCDDPEFVAKHEGTFRRLQVSETVELIMMDLLRRTYEKCPYDKSYEGFVKTAYDAIIMEVSDVVNQLCDLNQNTKDFIIWCYENDDFFYTDDSDCNWNTFMFKKYVKPVLMKPESA